MQTNYFANGFQQPVTKASKPIPGLKVAYGSQAQSSSRQYDFPLPIQPTQGQTQQSGKGVFAKLKDSLINLVTEEAPSDRPIGISQLSRKTFQAVADDAGQPTVFKQGQTIQDYRFNQLVDFKG
ncbi:MAG: hypothetical protein K0Q50_1280 [Vampirovibrio sp.]|jgi:hypothetical protein|nr:hypothetical protein [Vampirovibrio sp.]